MASLIGSRVEFRLSIVDRSILVASLRVVNVSSDNFIAWEEPLTAVAIPLEGFWRILSVFLEVEVDGADFAGSSMMRTRVSGVRKSGRMDQ